MQKHVLMSIAMIMAGLSIQAQVYFDHFDNDDPANTGGAGAFTHAEANSEWTITAATMSGPFDPFTYEPHDPSTTVKQFVDASGNNKVFVRAKASAIGTQLRLDLADTANIATTQAGLTRTLTTDFQVLEYDFTDAYVDAAFGGTGCASGPCPVDSSAIANLLFFANPGAGFAGTIVIDYVAFGAPPDTIITSDIYQDHFDDDSAVNNFTFLGQGYSVSQSGTELTITGDGTTPEFDPLTYIFLNRSTSDTLDLDITGNNKIYIKAKSTVPNTAFRVDVQDVDGFVSTAGSITKLLGPDYAVYEYNFTGVLSDLGFGGTPCTMSTAPCAVDGTRIGDLLFFIEPGAGGFLGDITIDYISFGVSLEPPGAEPELIYEDHFGNDTLEFTSGDAGFSVSEMASEMIIEGDGTATPFAAISYLLHDKDDGSEIFLDMTPGKDKVFLKAKVDSGTVPLRVDLIDTAGFITSQPGLTRVLTDEYTVFEYDFAGQYTDGGFGGTPCATGPCPVDFQTIRQILFYPDPVQGGFDGTIRLDFVSIGQPLEEDKGPKGAPNYADEMDDNTSLFISDPGGLSSTTTGGEWVITGDGTSGAFSSIVYTAHDDMGNNTLIDVMGSNDKLFVRAKASVDNTELRIDVQDNLGFVSNQSSRAVNLGTEYDVYELDYAGAYQDGGFGGSPCTTGPCPVDPERIANIQVFINAADGGYNGTVTIDWISFGTTLVGIQEIPYVQGMRLYPNPVTEALHVDYQLEQAAALEFKLTNLVGQQVIAPMVSRQAPGAHAQLIDLQTVPAGMYILQVWADGQLANTARVIKK